MTTLDAQIEQLDGMAAWDFSSEYFALPVHRNTYVLRDLLIGQNPLPDFVTPEWLQQVDDVVCASVANMQPLDILGSAQRMMSTNQVFAALILGCLHRAMRQQKTDILALLGETAPAATEDSMMFSEVTVRDLAIHAGAQQAKTI